MQRLGLVAAAVVMACGGESQVAGNILPDNRITQIRIAPSSASLAAGDSLDLSATAYNAAGLAILPASFSWSSSAPTVASVSAVGRVTALAAGAAAISATSAGVTGTATIDVTFDSVVASVAITPSTATVQVGSVVALGAVAKNAAGRAVPGKVFSWASSDPATATVASAGAVTGVAVGTATITATAAGKSATALVTVSALADTVVANVAITPSTTTVEIGAVVALGVVATNAAGQTLGGKTFTWTSSDPARASVNASGVVTGVALGAVTVTAATAGKSGITSITVIPFSTSTGTITVNGAQKFQTMKGWEALSGMGHGECDVRAQATYFPQVFDRAVNEVGINRLKLPLRAGYEHPVDLFQQFEAGLITFDQWKAAMFIPQNDNNDPFVINPAGFNWSHLDYGIESQLLPLKQRLQARGDDLWFSLQFNGARGAAMHRDNPEEYAEIVIAAFQHIRQKYGLVPNSLEIVNEPNLAQWVPAPVGHMAVAAKRRLNQAGFFPEFIAPSASGIASTIMFFDQITPIPGVTQTLTDIAYHRYGGGATTSQLQAVAQRAAQYGMSTAMTEHGGSGYDVLHQDLTVANVSAWEQFGLAFCSDRDVGGVYFPIYGAKIGSNSPNVLTGAMTKFLRQYFRYVALRAVRVGAASADARFAPVAFRNANGKYVVVVNAAAGGSFTVGGLPAGTYGIDYTTASEYMRALPDVTISGSQPVSTSIPTTGVLTIFAK
ncbi:MAG: Ig-like domain-containing protein [Gemmatimonadaceae bacterium]